jgi:hypothetical protein
MEGDPSLGPPEIPTLSGVGTIVLVLLIAGLAVLVLVRSRS